MLLTGDSVLRQTGGNFSILEKKSCEIITGFPVAFRHDGPNAVLKRPNEGSRSSSIGFTNTETETHATSTPSPGFEPGASIIRENGTDDYTTAGHSPLLQLKNT